MSRDTKAAVQSKPAPFSKYTFQAYGRSNQHICDRKDTRATNVTPCGKKRVPINTVAAKECIALLLNALHA